MSLDGRSAYDCMSRAAFLTKLQEVAPELLLFVRMFHGRPSTYSWWDDQGRCRDVKQGEGCEQGDPLAPALFALGQHDALHRAAAGLHPDDSWVAFLDELYITTTPSRARTSLDMTVKAVADHCGIGSNLGKTRAIGARDGPPPPGIAELGDEVWRGDLCPEQRGIVVLGTPIGHQDFVQAWAARRLEEEEQLLSQLPKLPDLQCSWLLPLLRASPRANHALRTVPPLEIQAYARAHDQAMWHTLKQCLGGAAEAEAPHAKTLATMTAAPARQHTGQVWRMPCRPSKPDSLRSPNATKQRWNRGGFQKLQPVASVESGGPFQQLSSSICALMRWAGQQHVRAQQEQFPRARCGRIVAGRRSGIVSSCMTCRAPSWASHSATGSKVRASVVGIIGGASRSRATSSPKRGLIRGQARHAWLARSVRLPAAACNRGTNNHELRSPGTELGGRASCQGNGSALVFCCGGVSGERGGLNPGVASPGAIGAMAPESSAPRGEVKGVAALSVSDSVTAASVSEPAPLSSRWRGDVWGGRSCICAKACQARFRRRTASPMSGGPR